MKKLIKSIFILSVLWFWFFTFIFAQNLEIIPKSDNEAGVIQAVDNVAASWWHVRDVYNQEAKKMAWKVGDQLASWIMTRDTLLDYVVYLIKFLSQVWLVIWTAMILYAWYLYATTIFWSWDATKWKKAIKDAIIWVVVIIFSYAIMKLLISAFIS